MRLFVILGAVGALLTASAGAAEPPGLPPPPRRYTEGVETARVFVDQLFAPYAADALPDLFDKPELTFEPELAAAITTLAARMEQDGDMPDSFGADPLCNCQDYGDVSYRIGAIGQINERATVMVSFSNFGQVERRRVELLRTPAGWRVFDIDGTFRSNVMADLAAPQDQP
jgi:hypothetical protein